MYTASRSIKSASLLSKTPLWEASMVLHGELNLNASFAAATARFISASPPCWTSVITSPVVGFTVSNVLPDFDLCHSLLIKICPIK